MIDEEIWEWMQRDMDGDLSPEERRQLLDMLRNDPDLQLKYDRLKRVSEQLEQLPPVTPPYSLVDAILPQLESGSARPAAESGRKREQLPKLEVKQAASVAEKPAKWRRAYVWMARIGSGAVAACLLVFLLFMGSDDKRPEVDGYKQGTHVEPPAVAPAVVGPPTPPPSTHSSSVTPGEQPTKPAQTAKPKAAEKKERKPKAEPKSQPAKPAAKPKKTVEPKPPVRPIIEPTEEKPVFPIGLEEKQEEDDKEQKKSDMKEKKEHDSGDDDRDERNDRDDEDDHPGSDNEKTHDKD
jgi:hypothetical protein